MCKPMTVSELIKVLSKMHAEHGDAEISINTHEGSLYSLYSDADVQFTHYYDTFGKEISMIEIG
jgi:hypothetical protein